MFSELHSTCPERHFELIFSKLHFSRNFADSFSAILSKKQSSCPEKELWKTKFEKWSKVKQFFSVFDRKNVGRLVETALHVFGGTFWKLSLKNLIYYKFVSNLSEKISRLWAVFQVWLSKLHSTCPQKCFQARHSGTKTIWKILFLQFFCQNLTFGIFFWLWPKCVGRLVKTASYVLRGTFWKVFRETQYLMFSFIDSREISCILIDFFFTWSTKLQYFKRPENVFSFGEKQLQKLFGENYSVFFGKWEELVRHGCENCIVCVQTKC